MCCCQLADYEEGTEDDRLDVDVDFDNAEDPTESLQEPNKGAELLHEADVNEVLVEEGSLQPPDVNHPEPARLQQTPEEQTEPLGAGFASEQEQDPSQLEHAGGETVQPKQDLDESDQGIGEGDDAELDDLDDIGPGLHPPHIIRLSSKSRLPFHAYLCATSVDCESYREHPPLAPYASVCIRTNLYHRYPPMSLGSCMCQKTTECVALLTCRARAYASGVQVDHVES